MYVDSLQISDELFGFDLEIDADDVIEGYRDRYGAYRVGRLEEDPEQMDYEEMLELGWALSR